MSLKDVCRACLRTGPIMCPLLESIVPKFDSPPNSVIQLWKIFSNMLTAYDDSYFDKICIECLDEIQRIYSFILKCKKSEVIFMKMKNIKIYLKKLKTVSLCHEHDSSANIRSENDVHPNILQIKTENIEWTDKTDGDDAVDAICDHRKCDVRSGEFSVRQDIKHEPELDICMENNTFKNAEFDELDSESKIEIFKCPACCYDYRVMEGLEKHIITTHMKGQMCKLCNKEFESSATEHCSMHLHAISTGKVPKLKHHKCKVCSKKFGCKFTLTRHLLLHTGEKPFKCELCPKSFRQKNNLTYHFRCHTGEKPFKCVLCPKTFLLKNRFVNHLKRHKQKNKRKNSRKQSKVRINANVDNNQVDQSSQDTSIIQDQNDNLRMKLIDQLQCENDVTEDEVLVWVKQISELDKCMKKNEFDEIEPEDTTATEIYECPACRFASRIMENLEQHLIEDHMDLQRKLCKLCNRVFKCTAIEHCSSHLHMNSTEGSPTSSNMKYQCNVCSKIFGWKSNLNEHLKIHAGKRPYKCEICPKTFQREAPFLTHLRKHTEKNHTKYGYNPEHHKCKVCSKIFRCKSNLKRHIMIHTGERPFKCDICPKTYQQKIGLQNHLMCHIGQPVVS